jgi:hypothetical protein
MRHQLLVAFTLVAFLVVSTTITTADIMEGLVGYWPMNDGVGDTAADATGNGHDGKLDGPVWAPAAEARMGKGALTYDGEDDRVRVDSFDLAGGSGITIAAWLKPNGYVDDARVVSKAQGGGTGDHYWAVVLSGNGEDDLQFRLRTNAGATSKVTVPDGHEIETGVWTHIAVTWDANDPNMRFYKNGEEIHFATKDGTTVGDGPDVEIGIGNQSVSAGADSMDRPFNGIMDDVAIWNRGLSQAEIAEMMTVGIPFAVEANGKLATAWGAIKLEL